MNEKPYNYPAIKVRYPVTLLTAEGHLHGETRLINNRGALIRCHQPPRLHETATISIDISENETLMVEAEVVRLEFYEHRPQMDIQLDRQREYPPHQQSGKRTHHSNDH